MGCGDLGLINEKDPTWPHRSVSVVLTLFKKPEEKVTVNVIMRAPPPALTNPPLNVILLTFCSRAFPCKKIPILTFRSDALAPLFPPPESFARIFWLNKQVHLLPPLPIRSHSAEVLVMGRAPAASSRTESPLTVRKSFVS